MNNTIENRIAMAISELNDWAAENPDDDDPGDTISEIADSCVPVYHRGIIDVATSDYDLILSEPEIGPAFDGSPTPVNIMAANIYERLERELWDAWRGIEEAREESDDEEDDDDA